MSLDYETLRREVHGGQAVKLSGGVLLPGDEYTIQRADGSIWTIRCGYRPELWSLPAHEVVATFPHNIWNWRHLDYAKLNRYIESQQAVDAVETMLGVLK